MAATWSYLRRMPAAADQPAAAELITHIALATTDTRQATELVRQAGYTIKTEPKDVQLGPIFVHDRFFHRPEWGNDRVLSDELVTFTHQGLDGL